MSNRNAWIVLGAMILALLGSAGAQAGVAIDNAVMLDPYDPVPPIQFSHWYGGCYSECGHHCRHECVVRASCDEGCYRERDCNDRCDGGCARDCERDCDGCRNVDEPGIQANAAPCTTGDCYESERWEHRWRDGDHVANEWSSSGRRVGDRRDRSYDDSDDDDPGSPDAPQQKASPAPH